MSSEYIKEWLSRETKTKPRDWKRISKKGSGINVYRQFLNLNDNRTIIVYGDRDENNIGYEDFRINIYNDDLIPDGFLIILPDSVKKENVTMDLILPNSEDAFWNDQDGISVFFTNSKIINGGMDQHISHFIEYWLGVKGFMEDFEEVSENNNYLVSNLSIQEIISKLEKVGLKFEGFENLYDWI